MNDFLSMWQKSRRRSGEPCLSDLFLDRLARGECTPQEREIARAHLGSCPSCAEADRALDADRRSFASEMDVSALAADALARASTTAAVRNPILRWLPSILALGVAAAGLLFWPRAENSGEMRSKGGFNVELFVQHAEGVAGGRLHLGESLHPGDRVRLRLPGGDDSYLAVLAVDTTGRVSVYYPTASPTTPLADPAQTALPGAIELDGTLGGEVLLAFRCPSPQPVRTLVDAVREALDRTRVTTDPAAAVGRPNTPCASARYRIEKVPGAKAP